MKHVLFAVLLAMGLPGISYAEGVSANDEILRLIKAKIPENIIILKIAELRPRLDTSTDALVSLSEAGASEAVLSAFMNVSPTVIDQTREEKFKFNSVSLVSFSALKDEYRVTLKLANNGDLNHEFLSGTSVSPEPLPSSCEQATLNDDEGTKYVCVGASLPLDPAGPYNAQGVEVAPGDSVLVTYSFTRPIAAGPTAGGQFTFAARPVVLFKHKQMFLEIGTQMSAELAIEFSGIAPR